jgi:hypothetical protein
VGRIELRLPIKGEWSSTSLRFCLLAAMTVIAQPTLSAKSELKVGTRIKITTEHGVQAYIGAYGDQAHRMRNVGKDSIVTVVSPVDERKNRVEIENCSVATSSYCPTAWISADPKFHSIELSDTESGSNCFTCVAQQEFGHQISGLKETAKRLKVKVDSTLSPREAAIALYSQRPDVKKQLEQARYNASQCIGTSCRRNKYKIIRGPKKSPGQWLGYCLRYVKASVLGPGEAWPAHSDEEARFARSAGKPLQRLGYTNILSMGYSEDTAPDGAILVYKKGPGHIEIKDGSQYISDHIANHPRSNRGDRVLSGIYVKLPAGS